MTTTNTPIALQTRTSKAAIFSLVCGILFCVPVVTNLAAIIFGVVGLRKTREGGVKGRGLAWTGLMLGIVSLLVWGGIIGGTGYAAWRAKQFVDAQVAKYNWVGQTETFVNNLATQSPEKLQQLAPNMATGDIMKLQQELRALGKPKSVQVESVGPSNNFQRFEIGTKVGFENGEKRVKFAVVIEGENVRLENFAITQ